MKDHCFSADSAVDLWWSSCCTTRRVNQGPRKPYRSRSDKCSSSAAPQSDTESEEVHLVLNDWDNWFETSTVGSDIQDSSDSDDIMAAI